jgi:uncharacterized membrane protein
MQPRDSLMDHAIAGRRLHAAFEVSLLLKGAFAAAEVAAGLITFFIRPGSLLHLAMAFTRAELTEDPRDFVALHLLRAAQDFSGGTQHFVAFYLLTHGVIKLWLITGLWQGRRAYYPAGMGVFGLFILYQGYRYTLTGSPLLLFITVLDGVMIWLAWAEYRTLRHKPRAGQG